MTDLTRKALIKADNVRTGCGLDIFQPINVFDACISLGLSVRFININMEGMYVSLEDSSHPNILLSNQRPMPRRNYTCAHELGHHVFGHGTKVDALEEKKSNSSYDYDELLVDTFAGALLMPVAGIQAEFSIRDLNPESATPIQFYTISSFFGTGYQTLITHCRVNRIISELKAMFLLKHKPMKILESIIGSGNPNSYFKIIDDFSFPSVIDLEVSNYIILPHNIKVEGTHLEIIKETPSGNIFIAIKSGIVRARLTDNSDGCFIRIQNKDYIGLAENRHLEN